ncbi:MAG: type IV pilus twitching motility protein PilT [Actinobacteria bacterium]|nr:type IV pilus twitching motility protein PilT [Chloroflexota bacterium]MBE3128564.1 type IV pilus twitching motility protein PilT [Actinomycetota bacterium]
MDINDVLIEAIKRDASDIHIVCALPPVIRINGRLTKLEKFGEITPEISKKILIRILNEEQIRRLEKQLAVDFSHTLPGYGRFRCSYFYQRNSLAAAFRYITRKILSIEDLNLPVQIEEFADYPRGLVLVTGPTGCGKSTTLASIINLINNNRSENIITIEDPIEYLFTHKKSIVSQREVLTDTRSFGAALKYILREDPNVIMVGEIRDLETISSTLTAAETGHLVFSTLHTQDAPQTIDRIIDIFPTHQQNQVRSQLAGILKAVLVQQLIPNKDNTGRLPATELMFVTPAIKNMIREMKGHQIYSAIQAGGKRGMMTMDMSLANLYKDGKITEEMALEKAHNRDEVKRMIHE